MTEIMNGFMGSGLQEDLSQLTRGIDVSHWQGSINFQQTIANGNKFVAMKATQGTSFIDSRLNENHANSVGLYRMPYHFWDNVDPGAQADHFYNTIKGKKWELPPVLDFERTGTRKSHVKMFLEIMTSLYGKKPIIYTSPYIWNQLGDTSAWANDYDLWVAHWGVSVPTLPNYFRTWKFWQYSSTGNGSQNGVQSQYVDLDYFNGSEQDLANYSGGNNPPPPPPSGKQVKITATALNLRDAPSVPPYDESLGYTVKDRVWNVVEEKKDSDGRLWYKGEVWFASWWTEEV